MLNNAINFSHGSGGVTVKGKVKGSERLVKVTNRGIGIPKGKEGSTSGFTLPLEQAGGDPHG